MGPEWAGPEESKISQNDRPQQGDNWGTQVKCVQMDTKPQNCTVIYIFNQSVTEIFLLQFRTLQFGCVCVVFFPLASILKREMGPFLNAASQHWKALYHFGHPTYAMHCHMFLAKQNMALFYILWSQFVTSSHWKHTSVASELIVEALGNSPVKLNLSLTWIFFCVNL